MCRHSNAAVRKGVGSQGEELRWPLIIVLTHPEIGVVMLQNLNRGSIPASRIHPEALPAPSKEVGRELPNMRE